MKPEYWGSLIILVVLVAASCTQDKTPAIKGHWHSIESNSMGIYQTLDINDSVSIIDQYTLSSANIQAIPLKDGEDIVLPTIFNFNSKVFHVTGDTLFIESEFKYKRVDHCLPKNDLFSNLFIRINLPDGTEGITFANLNSRFHPIFISVGKLKKGLGYTNASGEYVNSDSFFIQIDDVLPGLEYIPAFIITENRLLDGQKELAIVLNLDQNAPVDFVDSLMNIIGSTDVKADVYQTYWNPENQIPTFKLVNRKDGL